MILKEIPLIVVSCYLFGELYKVFFNKRTYKLIPIILPILGGVLSIVMYLTDNTNIFSNLSIWDVILLGIFSGACSTGTNQIVKQILG